jgi:thioredoxin reductase (NADPH)
MQLMTRQAFQMTALDASDPVARLSQTNPVLSAAQAERVLAFGRTEEVPAGARLFTRGERGRDLLLVMSGAIEVFDIDHHGDERVLIVHGPGQFSGELDLFSDQPILVNGCTGEDSRIVRVPRRDLRRLLTAEPDIGETLMRAFILRRTALVRHGLGAIAVVGDPHEADVLRIQRFLTRNSYPHRLLDIAVPGEISELPAALALRAGDLPVVVDGSDRILRNPSDAALAEALGIAVSLPTDHVFDVAVVGAGPAGLAAAVYAASEGLDTLVIESTAPGGQAGTSSKIENYLGFPTGISGQALAGRAQVQAVKFGAKLAISRAATEIAGDRSPYRVRLDDGHVAATRTIVVATGARYRKLDLPNCARFEGQGILYAATAIEAALCRGQEVIVVGGGNSAGQAAVFLARCAHHVHVLVRGPGLQAMSSYLAERIAAAPNISVHPYAEVTALDGDHALRSVTWSDRRAGASERHEVEYLFSMIGAEPYTDWLRGRVALDEKGFVRTGVAVDPQLASPFATTLPGVFAVGDVRSGSTKRVASSVGEGAMVVQAVHGFIASAAA